MCPEKQLARLATYSLVIIELIFQNNRIKAISVEAEEVCLV